VAPEDFIVVPELFGFVMSQITKLPCGKIVLSQAYDHVLETLQPGENWNQLGFYKCITTSETQKEYLESVMRNVSYDVLPPYISDNFTHQKFPPKPIIGIHSREQRDSINLIKNFYVKFPQYRWITFKDMRGLSEKEFANVIQDCFLSVWIDETSSYGTFPLESMKSGVPVLGLTPNMIPQWMNSDNGLWVNNKIQMVDFVADFLQNWLEDNVNETLYVEMKKTVENLPTKEYFEKQSISLFEGYINTRLDSFEEQLNKLISVE
jgi:glycosyltransferase involved in cell wall biosynthesis